MPLKFSVRITSCKSPSQFFKPRNFSSRSPVLFKKKKVERHPEYLESLPVFQYATKNTKQKTRVYCWGISSTGALGNKNYLMPEQKNVPAISYLHKPGRLKFADTHKITDVACGYGFSVFAVNSETNEYQVFGTGLNTDSQIGYHCNRPGHPLEILIEPVPIELPLVSSSTKAVQVSCGRSHTVIVTDNEGVFTLGNNSFGQCGRKIIEDEDYANSCVVAKVKGIPGKVIKAFCGQDHTHFLTDEGHVYSSGMSSDGQTGLGHYASQAIPERSKGDIENERIVHVSCAADCVLAVNDKGDLFGWGNSEYGQLSSITSEQQVHTPTHIPLPDIGKIGDAAAGGTMCAVVSESGQVFVWGFGILGKGPNVSAISSPEALPQPLFGVNEFDPKKKVSRIFAGLDYFAALADKGDLYTWGQNSHGKLGLGDTKNQYFPLRVSLGGVVQKVSVGVSHVAAMCKSFM